ncbi:afadin- and alpha-actinin-binding protein B-like isoform X5 [Takifugu rubripes]|uniref:afadin- and alpha-actinin-binding protein B-like isoform X5 n=1 Tax=Takifugu rubripes TaxID=31033 RepID=UPI001145B144|nr:afadin- and alpha-actinin-binding protein B-like isoform X5 [Takifugu rubripes]
MSAMFGRRRVGRCPDCSDLHLLRDPDTVNELSHSAPQWTHREECRQQGEILREQFQEMEEHVARLQDALEHEKAKSKRLQLRSNQQEAALRRQEQQLNRLKDRLTDRPRDKGPSMDVLNLPPGEQLVKTFRSAARREEAALRLVLERREAELREAMKLRHSLTTLLHALRVNMEHTLSGGTDAGAEGKCLAGAEATLGDHVTGGVVQRWRQVQRRLGELLSEGQTGADTDQDKLLARLESDLRESQQLVRLQQQLLQDSLASPVPPELADGYFLEEWQRLQRRWAELRRQRRTFERERRSFTDAAVRLGREVSAPNRASVAALPLLHHPSRGQLVVGVRKGLELEPPTPPSFTRPSTCHITAAAGRSLGQNRGTVPRDPGPRVQHSLRSSATA